MRIVLASQSPRRRELFKAIGIEDFDVMPAAGEEVVRDDVPPYTAVELTAGAKAREVAEKCAKEDLVVAADTMVWLDGVFLGKPADEKQAREMLRALSGAKHTVYTGVAIVKGGKTVLGHEATDVYFRELTDAEIDWYISTGEPMDKAGAYGAQERGSLLVERIDGDFFNVMGFPLVRFYKMLDEMGFKLLEHLSKGGRA